MSDVTVEAADASGAVVTYDAPATHDDVDGDGVATCAPASGSTFALGGTLVTCDATDAAGNDAVPVTFTVSVVDTTAPSIAAHAGVVAWTDNNLQKSRVVTYTAPATSDAVDGAGAAVCSPASGSVFAMGNTTVSCSATDAAGNVATSTFNVEVAFGAIGHVSFEKASYTALEGATGAIRGVYLVTSMNGVPLRNVDVRVHLVRATALGFVDSVDLVGTTDADGEFTLRPGAAYGLGGNRYHAFGTIRMVGYPPAFSQTQYAVTAP